MKHKTSKLLSILLALVMVAGLMPLGQVAYAAGITDADNVFVNDHNFYNPSKLYYTNGASDTGSLADNPNWNAHYDPATGVLELKNYNGGGIYAGGLKATDLTIKLTGNNTVTATGQEGVSHTHGGNIIITSDSSGALTINISSSTTDVNGISAGYASSFTTGNVTFSGNANVTVNATATSTDYGKWANGIYAKERVSILDNASYTAVCKSATQSSGGQAGSGIYAQGGGVTLNTSGTVNIDTSQAGVYSYGIASMGGSNQVTKVSSMTIKYKRDGSNGVPIYPQNMFDSVANNYAININDTDCVATYRYGTPYTVTVSNGKCDASRKSTGQYLANDTVTITANTLSSGLTFKKWTSSDVTFANANSSTTTFTMPSKDVKVTADYNAFAVQPSFTATDAEKGNITFTLAAETTEAPRLVTKDGDESDIVGNMYISGTGTSRTQMIYNGTGTYEVPAGEYRIAARIDGYWLFSDPFTVAYTAPTTYTITFNANGGSVTPTSGTTGTDGKLTSLPTPTHTNTNMQFLGWFTAATGGTEVKANDTVFTGNDTIYAHWKDNTPSPTTYTITFNANGGSVTPTSGTTDTNGKLTSLPTPTHTNTNMQFLGWFTAATGGTEVKANDTVFTGNDTIYAHWKDNTPSPTAYTITFNANGGSVTPTSGTTGTDGKLASLPTPTHTNTNMQFLGWFTAASGGTEVKANDTVFTGNDTIYAHWKDNTPSPTTYTITFNANGGSVTPASGTTGTDGKLTSLPTPTRSGSYTFNGWYTAATGGTKVDTNTVFTANDTIYAHWTYTGGGGGGGGITTQYTLTYQTNGGSAVSATKHNSGATVTLTATPTKEGFTFDGWYSDAALTSKITSIKMDGNKTVYAGWKENENPNTGAHDCPSKHLKDVDINAWYHEYVDYVIENGLMYGIADDRFGPDVTTSRAMIVTILYRLENSPAVEGSSPFEDVAEGLWYTDAVKWAEANEIVEGYSPEKFGPNDLITREQLAAIMYRYSAFKGYDTSKAADLAGYTDASSISDWAVPAMKWAVAEGLIAGRTTTTLVPRGNATRAEAATILMRYIEKTK